MLVSVITAVGLTRESEVSEDRWQLYDQLQEQFVLFSTCSGEKKKKKKKKKMCANCISGISRYGYSKFLFPFPVPSFFFFFFFLSLFIFFSKKKNIYIVLLSFLFITVFFIVSVRLSFFGYRVSSDSVVLSVALKTRYRNNSRRK